MVLNSLSYIIMTICSICLGYILYILGKSISIGMKSAKAIQRWQDHMIRCFDKYKKDLLDVMYGWEDFLKTHSNILKSDEQILILISESASKALADGVDKLNHLDIVDLHRQLERNKDPNALTRKLFTKDISKMYVNLFLLKDGLLKVKTDGVNMRIFTEELTNNAAKKAEQALLA